MKLAFMINSFQQQEHIFIIRKAMKVPEGYDFLYSCSCDLERRQFAQSLGNEVTQPLETGTYLLICSI